MTPIPVHTLAQVRRADDGVRWSCDEYDIAGTVTPREDAVRRTVDGHVVTTWREDHHVFDDRCPACMSALPCRQRVDVYEATGHLVVVHQDDLAGDA